MLNLITFSLPTDIETQLSAEMQAWNTERKIARIWERDASVWTGSDEAKWLGWLDVVDREKAGAAEYLALEEEFTGSGFTDILLMGMGGSSLCPEVLGETFEKDHFRILDSTVPGQVMSVEKELDLAKTLFIVSSKSGTTLEPNCFKQYFFDRLAEKAGRENAGRQFIAITDPGSKMEAVAREDGFRHIFFGEPQIGGRFSALSAFGLVPAALMGIDTAQLLQRAGQMAEACRSADPLENPGALLGLILGVCHRLGRDKLTIFASPEIYDLGAWLEQLIAESTGKEGVAIIPIDREPVLQPEVYGDGRVFVRLSVKGGSTGDEIHYALQELEKSGHPFISVELESLYHIAQEFYRWEFATAVAGAVMGINPFNQPDVESAKVEARKLTEEYERTGSLPDEQPFFEAEGIQLFTGADYASELGSAVEEPSLSNFLEAHLLNLEPGDYFALLAYIEMNAANDEMLQKMRRTVLEQHAAATCVGYGPRFLHSTGQAYKGGPNTGVFLQITADDRNDLPVPGQSFSFGVVKAAQARGDFQVLVDRGRRALRVHLQTDLQTGLRRLAEAMDHSGEVSI